MEAANLQEPRGLRRRRRVLAFLGTIGLEAAATWLRSGRLGGRLIVRCRQGHLYTTIWIPAVSVKSLRLGWWRIQRCPVGEHWSVVTPVRQSELTSLELRRARRKHDVSVP